MTVTDKGLLQTMVFSYNQGCGKKVPEFAYRYLEQAYDSLTTSPDGVAIQASSAIGSMQKEDISEWSHNEWCVVYI